MKLLKITGLVTAVWNMTAPVPPPVIEIDPTDCAVVELAVAPKSKVLEVALTSVTPNRAAVPWVIVIPVEVSVFQTVPVPDKFNVEFPRINDLVFEFEEENSPTECVRPALSVNPSKCKVPIVKVNVLVTPRLIALRK